MLWIQKFKFANSYLQYLYVSGANTIEQPIKEEASGYESQIYHFSIKVLKVLYVFLAYAFQIHIFKSFTEHLVDYVVSLLNTKFKSMFSTTECLKEVLRKKLIQVGLVFTPWECLIYIRVMSAYQEDETKGQKMCILYAVSFQTVIYIILKKKN